MAILPDPILMLIQAVPFAITLIVLNKLIFQPMIAYLNDREVAIVGSRDDALQLQDTASDKLNAYEARVAEARAQVASERNTARNTAMEKREALIAEARSQAEAKVAEAVAAIEGERALASEELDRLSRTLAGDITTQVLGSEVAAK